MLRKARVAQVDEDAKSSHSKDDKREEVLINKRVLLSRENEPNQRIFFCTRCKCEDKCCDVIINGASTDNLVLEMMFTKLQMKRQKYLHPYCIAWVQDDHNFMVNEQC